MTITVGMIGSQRGPAINPLLIFMSAIRVNSGTAEARKKRPLDPPRACNCRTKRRCRRFIIRLTAPHRLNLVSAGFRAPIELDGYRLDEGVGRFLEFSPFLCFR
jgi:hypothetical protein